MGLSLKEYEQMKAAGLVKWDENALSSTGKNINSYLDGVRRQSMFEGQKWGREEFQKQRGQLDTLRGQLRYLQSYAESIKGSDTERYAALTESAKTLGEGLDSAESWFKDNGESFLRHKQWQAHSEAKRAQELQNAASEMLQGKSAAETAAKYGLNESELQQGYKQMRAQQKQEDRENKYSGMGFDELMGTLKSQDSLGQRIYNEILDEYGVYFKDYGDFDKNRVFQSRGEKYGLTGEQVKEIYERISNKDDKYYESRQLSDKDREYIVQQILKTGTPDELKALKNNLPVASYYDSLRYGLNQAIEDRNEQLYYLDIAKQNPRVTKVMESVAAIDAEINKLASTTGAPTGHKGQFNNIMDAQAVRASYMRELEASGYDAEKMVKYYKRYQERMKNEEQQNALKKWTSQSGLNATLASIASIPVNMIGSLGDVGKIAISRVRELFGDDVFVDPKGTANYTAQNIRGTVNEMIGDEHHIAQLLYSTGMSMGDMALAAAANAVPVIGQAAANAMFFSSAGVSAANEVIENGGDLRQATAALIASGGAELLFERLSLDKLEALATGGSVENAETYFKNIVKQAFVEGSEEFHTTLANTLTDALINGGNSSFERRKRAYMEQGLDEKKAENKALQEWTRGIIDDAVGGAISGGVLGGVAGAQNAVKTNHIMNVGGLALTAGDFADLTSGSNSEAVDAGVKIVKDKGAAAVLEAAAQSENAQTRQTAAHFAELNKQGKLDDRDAAQLLVKLANEQEVIHGIDALAASEGKETLTDFRQKKSRVAEYNSGFDLSGRRAEDGGTLETNAADQEQETVKGSSFGAAHPNGVAAHTADGKEIVVRGIESSLPEYGGDRGVTLQLADGSLTDAEAVTLDSGDYQRLLNLAANFDTLGARALLYHYESAGQNGMSLDDYTQAFHAVYENGRRGLDYAHAMQNPTFEALSRDMGAEAFRGALEAGNNDGTIDAQARNHFEKRVRVKGIPLGKSRVRMEPDVDVTLSDDGKEVLQAVAEKSGKEIVLTNALSSEDRGAYRDNKLYLRADLEEHVMVITALHEAVHNMKAYAPQDFRVLQQFVVNYLVSQGKSIETELASLSVIYGKDAPTDDALTEELICKTVESLAADTEALNTALSVKENQPLKEKIAAILKRIADAVAKFFKGDKEMKLSAHNRYAQTFLDDVKALRDMAELVSKGFDTARENEREFGERKSGNRHSYAGADAKTADHSLLQQAQEMERQGKASEQIRQETGWHKGYDGKWRFEIDDSGMTINERIFTGGTLEDLIKHDALFEAYPQLKKLRYEFERLSGGARGYTTADGSCIVLDKTLRADALNGDTEQLKKTLIHEIQHVIQKAESFASGTNIDNEYKRGDKVVFGKLQESRKRLASLINRMYNGRNAIEHDWNTYDDILAVINEVDGKMRDAGGYDSFAGSKGLMQLRKITDRQDILDAYRQWVDALGEADIYQKSPSAWARNRYYNTAGEIEARDTADRLDMSEQQRKEKRPDIDRDDVVFADGGVSYEIKKDIEGNAFVDVDTSLFNPEDGETVAKTIARIISERFKNSIRANGQSIQINKTTNDEWRMSKSARYLQKNDETIYSDKLKVIVNADELLKVANNWVGEELKHNRKDDIVEFARGNVRYRVGNNGYVADVIVGTRKNGAAVLYDIKNIYKTKIAGTNRVTKVRENSLRTPINPANNNVSHTNKKSNPSQQNNSDNVKYSKDDTIYEEPYNQYSIKKIEQLIAVGAKHKDLSMRQFIDEVYDYGEAALPFLNLGYEHPDFKPEIRTFYRIGEPRLGRDGTYRNSFNYADDKFEEGVSVVTSSWLHSNKSVFFGTSDEDIKRRGVYKITGFAIPSNGGDDETLVVPMDWAVKTRIRTKKGLATAVRTSEEAYASAQNDDSGKFSKDDTIIDPDELDEELLFTSDGDLSFDAYGTNAGKVINVEQLMQEQGAEQAIYTLYNAAARTAERGIKGYNGVRLERKNFERVARGVMKQYSIAEKQNPEMVTVIADRLEEYVNAVKRGKKADFDTFLNALATDCKRWLERSGDYSRGSYEEDAKKLYGILRGKTIILSSYDESAVLDEYGGDIRKLRSQLRGYVNVGFAEDRHRYKNPIQIQDVIDGFASETGDGYEGISPYFPGGESMDGAEAWDWLVKTLELFKPQFVSRYGNDFYYESMDAAAVDMALWLNSAIVDEKAQHAATIKKADRQTIRQLADDRHKALAEQKALHRAKQRQSEQQLDRMRQRYQRERGLRESAEEENDIMKRMAANDARDYRKQYNERQQKAALIRQLGAKLGSLTKRLDGKANKNAYIPESLKQPLLHVLQLFEVAPGNDREIPGYFGTFKQLNEVSARIGSLADVYEKLEGKTDFGKGDNLSIDINGLAYDKAVLHNLRDVAGMVSGKNVYQMTADDLKMVYEALNDLDHQLKEAVQIIVDGQKAMIQEFAEEGIKQTGEVRFSKDGRRWVTDTLRTARNKFVATSLDPVRYARMLSGYHDDGILYKAVLDLHRGDQKRTRIMQRAYTPVQAVIEGYQRAELVQLQRKAVEEFTMKDRSTGADVKLSQGMLLSIYLTNRQADGHRHLCAEKNGQYTRVPDLDYLNKNRVLPDLKGNKKRAHGDKSHEIVLTRDMLQRIDEYVERTPLLKDLAEAIHDVFNGTLADEINAVSMQRYGKLIATVKDYYPLKTDSNDPNKQYETSFDGENIFTDERLKTRGFTKQRTKSWTAVVIDDALDVFQRHVNETAEYCGFLIPVENIKKLINSGNDDILLRKAIENKFGGDAIHYLNKLLGDIQKRRDDDVESMLTRASGKAMGAALFMNVRSALKNWGAMPLANRYFGTGNVAKAAVVGFAEGRKLVEKYNDYTSYMWYRAEGNGTVVGELSRQQKLYGRITDKFDIMSWADQKVVNSLLYAAEQHVKQTTDLVYDSEEFKQEVARQFEKCIDESQPNSMLTSKPQFVRNVGMRVLSLNAFASQRMAMGNCLMDSFMEYDARRHEYQANKNAETKQAKKEAKKRFLKTALGVFESASLQFLLGALASMLVYHKWDDYKDKEGNVTPGSFFSGIGWNALKGIPEELAGSFAWADKLYSAAEKLIDKDAYGPDFDVMSLSAALEVYDAVQKRNFPKAWGKFADMTGLYVFGGSTEQRLVQSVRSYGTDIWGGRLGFTDNKGAIDLNFMDVQIAEAISAGDVKQAEWLRALWESELEKKGESAGGIDAKIEKALAAGNDDIYNAAIARENGDIKTHKALTDKYINMGVSEEIVDKAVKQVISGMKAELKDGGFAEKDAETVAAELMTKGLNENAAAKIAADWLGSQKEREYSGMKYTTADAFNALKNGERDSYNDMVQYLAQAYLDSGKADSMKEAQAHIEKTVVSKNRTDKLFKERDDATDNDKGDTVRRVNRELLNIFGSEDAVKRAYEDYRKRQ